MNELGTIVQDFRTPVLDCLSRSARKAAAKATDETRARRNSYYHECYNGTFSPKECWKRCIGDGRKEATNESGT